MCLYMLICMYIYVWFKVWLYVYVYVHEHWSVLMQRWLHMWVLSIGDFMFLIFFWNFCRIWYNFVARQGFRFSFCVIINSKITERDYEHSLNCADGSHFFYFLSFIDPLKLIHQVWRTSFLFYLYFFYFPVWQLS